jgi:hypothetical protein
MRPEWQQFWQQWKRKQADDSERRRHFRLIYWERRTSADARANVFQGRVDVAVMIRCRPPLSLSVRQKPEK